MRADPASHEHQWNACGIYDLWAGCGPRSLPEYAVADCVCKHPDELGFVLRARKKPAGMKILPPGMVVGFGIPAITITSKL